MMPSNLLPLSKVSVGEHLEGSMNEVHNHMDETEVEVPVGVHMPVSDDKADVAVVMEGSVSTDVAAPDRPLLMKWKASQGLSFQEANSSVKVPPVDAPWWKQLAAYTGLGILISVGYMDPGNWATDIAGGSQFGYSLLCVILFSSACAMFLQYLAIKLGVGADRDLAQACRDAYPKYIVYALWVLAEIAIAATDLAEVIGCAIAFNLLFGIPMWAGVLLTLGDVILVMMLGAFGFRMLELCIALFTALIAACYIFELAVAKPNWADVMYGFVPKSSTFGDSDAMFVAVGIIGATVMPHNLYLHSSVIQTRAYDRTEPGKLVAIKYGTIDSCMSLFIAFIINAAILIVAGAAFYYGDPPNRNVTAIVDAFNLLTPSLGTHAASILFALALLAAGQNSTITGTLAGQIVMEGFLHIRIAPWLRRILTRTVAVIPAAIVAACMGASGMAQLLVLSQVILALQLPFAIVPLVHFTSMKAYVGNHSNNIVTCLVACCLAILIAGMNMYALVTGIQAGSFWQSDS